MLGLSSSRPDPATNTQPRPYRVPWLALVALVALLAAATASSSSAHEHQPPRDGFVTADDGVRLYYRVIGDGQPAAIVPLVHWNQEAFEERTTGRRFIFYDPRSRGRSDTVPVTELTLDRDLRDLDAVRRHFALERVSIVGTSYYGAMAILYARHYPDHVDSLFLVGAMSPVAALQMGHQPAESAKRITPADEAHLAELAEGDPVLYCREYWRIQRKRMVGRVERAEVRPTRCSVPNEWPQNITRWAGGLFTALGNWDWSDVGPEVTARTLVVHGDTDLVAPLEGSRRWAASMPNARLLVLESAGHVPWSGMPETIFPLLEEFLGGAWPAGAEVIEDRSQATAAESDLPQVRQ